MTTKIIRIGNSRGVRLPKLLLDESGLGTEVEVIAKAGEIRIVPAKKSKVSDSALLSEEVLGRDWLRPEEDEAWKDL
ncbi:MAG TPA: hypothetical protein VH234_00335 [Candidatus Saccharimonadales bacterium]|jgi:antitoxin MazE|nr:hypothetical protein [Candidatus Saccharimonadales bacterium]